MNVQFSMQDRAKEIACAISTSAGDRVFLDQPLIALVRQYP